jgi:hypothetical protein
VRDRDGLYAERATKGAASHIAYLGRASVSVSARNLALTQRSGAGNPSAPIRIIAAVKFPLRHDAVNRACDNNTLATQTQVWPQGRRRQFVPAAGFVTGGDRIAAARSGWRDAGSAPAGTPCDPAPLSDIMACWHCAASAAKRCHV